MKKKLTRARKSKARQPQSQPQPKKVRPASAAAPPPLPPEPPDPSEPPEPCGDGTLSIEAMLRAQVAATHLAAMDCLGRARIADSPEARDQALTYATRLLTLFTRQVNALQRGGWPAAAVGRGPRPAGEPVTAEIVAPEIVAAGEEAMGADDPTADAAPRSLAAVAEQTQADDPACAASFPHGGGRTPAPQNGAAGGSP